MPSEYMARTPFMEIIAKLNESDKLRIICCHLHSNVSNTNFKAAAESFGSASGNSMSVMYASAMRKARLAREGKSADTPKAKPNVKKGTSTLKAKNPTPNKNKNASASASGGVPKRKITPPAETEDDEETPPTPPSKKPKVEVKKEEGQDFAEALLSSDKPLV